MRAGRRFYAALLRLLPRGFRERRGPEMMTSFDEMRRELGREPGLVRLVGFYLRLTVDLLGRVRPERARAGRRGPGPSLERALRDGHMAMRYLLKRPLFLLVATFSLAIGIGANTAIFSVVNAVFIRQYPFDAPDELVRIYTQIAGRGDYGSTSYPNYLDLRRSRESFQDVGAFKLTLSRMQIADESYRVIGEGVSQNLFPMLGIDASLGRTFLPGEDEVPGAHPVVMLGYGFWQRAFGGDPDVLGRSVRLAGQPFTVVGVTPEGFQGLTASVLAADFFVPLVMYGTASGLNEHGHFMRRLERRYMVVARTLEGETRESVRTRLDVIYRRIKAANPEIDQEWSFSVVPFTDVAVDPDADRALQPFVVLLMAAGGLVLLLACTNLATFLLARGQGRSREIALRLALGAGRGALVRQLLTEAALLALMGGAAGLLLAQWTLGLLAGYQLPLPVSLTLDLGLDGRVLAFTFGVTALAGLISGLAPALRSSRPDLAPSLKSDRGAGRHRRLGFNNALVAAQIAMSVVLLVGGGLFVRSLAAAWNADLGFSVRDAGIAYVDLSVSGVPPGEYGLVTQQLVERVRALPGIESATAASHIPFLFGASGGFYDIPGVESPGQGIGHNVRRAEVDPAFFGTLGVPLVRGRGFSTDDRPGSPRVAVVNETAAGLFWPGGSPIGRVFFPAGSRREIEVVGVVGDTKMDGLRDPPRPFFYFPLAQARDPDLILVARGQPAPEAITVLLRDAIREVDPDLLVMDLKTMAENIGVVLLPVRVAALLLGVFGVLALTLATVGLYGVVSYSASRRTQEMGIRLSLGADAGAVRGIVVGGALRLVALGGAVGLAVALGLAQLLRPALFGVAPWDPGTVLGVPVLLGLVATAAAYLPALRASRVSPVEALRYE